MKQRAFVRNVRDPSRPRRVPLVLGYDIGALSFVASNFRPAPRTFSQHQRVAINVAPAKGAHFDFGAFDFIRRAVATDPQAEREARCTWNTSQTVPRRITAQILHRTNQTGRALELLGGEHPQRVAHEDIGAVAARRAAALHQQALMEHVERHHGEVGLRLAAAGGEPDEVHDFPVRRTAVTHAVERHQEKGDLERTPRAQATGVLVATRVDVPRGALFAAGAYQPQVGVPLEGAPDQLLGRDLLEKHREVGEPERAADARVIPQQRDPCVDATEAGVAGIEVTGGHRGEPFIQGSRLRSSALNPCGVFRREVFQRLPSGTFAAISQAGERAHRKLDAASVRIVDVRRHARKLDGGHDVRIKHFRRLPGAGIPAGSAAMTDAPRRGFAVEKSQRLLLGIELCERTPAFRIPFQGTVSGQHFKTGLVEHRLARLAGSIEGG